MLMDSIDWAPIILLAPGIILALTIKVYQYCFLEKKPKPNTLDNYTPGEIGCVIGGVVVMCSMLGAGFLC